MLKIRLARNAVIGPVGVLAATSALSEPALAGPGGCKMLTLTVKDSGRERSRTGVLVSRVSGGFRGGRATGRLAR